MYLRAQMFYRSVQSSFIKLFFETKFAINDYFQNQGCSRDNCRYVHAFREDVERYKRTGDVTLGLARALAGLFI